MSTPNTRARLLAVACATVLTISTAACGSSNDDDSSVGADTNAASSEQTNSKQSANGNDGTSGKPATDQDQIKALAARVQNGLKTGDGKAVCNSFTKAGQRDFVTYGQTIGFPGDCAAVAAAITQANKDIGIGDEPPAKVITVRIRGNKATALLRPPGGGPVRQRFIRTDGRWLYEPWQLARAVGATTTP